MSARAVWIYLLESGLQVGTNAHQARAAAIRLGARASTPVRLSMRHLAAVYGADFAIDSVVGRGTTVTVKKWLTRP